MTKTICTISAILLFLFAMNLASCKKNDDTDSQTCKICKAFAAGPDQGTVEKKSLYGSRRSSLQGSILRKRNQLQIVESSLCRVGKQDAADKRKYSDDFDLTINSRKNSAHPDGNSSSPTTYYWPDHPYTSKGQVQYRLQQLSLDGTITYNCRTNFTLLPIICTRIKKTSIEEGVNENKIYPLCALCEKSLHILR